MTKLESGRSMVEMLGVLAIIGVLSIGGIAGYTMAMNRNTANNITDAAAKLSVIAYARGQSNSSVTAVNFNEAGLGNGNNITNTMKAYTANGAVEVTVDDNDVRDILKQSGATVSSNKVTFNFSNN